MPSIGLEPSIGGDPMLHRQLLVIVLIFGNVSLGIPQNLGDFARAERARRKDFTGNRSNKNTPANSATREGLIKEAVRVSGARRQLEQALETFHPTGNEKRTDGISPQEYQQAVNDVFQMDRLIRSMEQSVPESVQDSTLTEVIRFYGSPLGRKISAAEISANAPDSPTQFQRYAATIPEKSIPAIRQEVVETISAAGLGIPRPPRDAANTLDSRGHDLWFQFVYSSFTDAELSSYLTFLKSPAAAEFNNSMWSGMDATLGDAAQRLAQRLAEKKR
jgi:hypothetical protein